ncbi:MAG: hypothetical protein ABF991_05225 [Liquorilactobacillus hordei]|uniref:hypothetical protein n=1 Tax=Liquorilactobacillus hordei TaxID=468911 RepID=UPI0039EC3A7A
MNVVFLLCSALILFRKKIFNITIPAVLFVFLWIIIVCLSMQQLFGLYLVENNYYNLIFIGILSFLIGAGIPNLAKKILLIAA